MSLLLIDTDIASFIFKGSDYSDDFRCSQLTAGWSGLKGALVCVPKVAFSRSAVTLTISIIISTDISIAKLPKS